MWGNQLAFLRGIEEETGITPQALLNAPFLEGRLLGEYKVFLEVSRNRSYTAGGPAPLSDGNLLDYYKANRIEVSAWDRIADAVKRIDDVWLTEHFEAAEAAKPTNNT